MKLFKIIKGMKSGVPSDSPGVGCGSCRGKILPVIFLLFSSLIANAGDNNIASIVEEADSAYNRGDYSRSETLWQKAIAENGATPALLYNLANACYKSGNEGYARLFLERAKKLDPSNDRINSNLEYLSTRINDANKAELKGKKGNVAPDEPGYFGRIRESIAVNTASDSWAEMAATAFILTILTLSLYIFSNVVRLKKIGFFSAIIMLIFTIIFVIFAEMAANHFESKDEVILTEFKSSLKASPEENAKDIGFPLHRGTKFSIIGTELDPDGKIGWYKVKLNRSNIGWLPAGELEII